MIDVETSLQHLSASLLYSRQDKPEPLEQQ